MLKDIVAREDIKLLIDQFYKQVIVDEVIGHFFTEVAQLNFEKHMPVMYDFWETTLLGNPVYKGNPMIKHIALNQKSELTQKHFDRWLTLWVETIDELFVGDVAHLAKERAKSIALLMQHKIKNSHF